MCLQQAQQVENAVQNSNIAGRGHNGETLPLGCGGENDKTLCTCCLQPVLKIESGNGLRALRRANNQSAVVGACRYNGRALPQQPKESNAQFRFGNGKRWRKSGDLQLGKRSPICRPHLGLVDAIIPEPKPITVFRQRGTGSRQMCQQQHGETDAGLPSKSRQSHAHSQ